MKKAKIGLVLSGGASLGYTHIGVIKRLQEEGINADIVVGTSMGAVVGAGYAIGMSVEEMVSKSNKMSISKFYDFNLPSNGFFSGKRMTAFLMTLYHDKTDKYLICKFATVSVD